jgi:hypothetical protein
MDKTSPMTTTAKTSARARKIKASEIVNQEALNNPNSLAIIQAMFKQGPLANFKTVKLANPWAQDFGSIAWIHPEHDNEALAYWQDGDCWVILDCCGDQSTYSDLSSALTEFTSPVGHIMWLELKNCGQHKEDRYFVV